MAYTLRQGYARAPPRTSGAAGDRVEATLELAVGIPQVQGLAVNHDALSGRAQQQAGDEHGAGPVHVAHLAQPLERAGSTDFSSTTENAGHGGFERSLQHQFGELFGRGGEVAALAWASVEFVGDGVEVGLGDGGDWRSSSCRSQRIVGDFRFAPAGTLRMGARVIKELRIRVGQE